MTKATAAAIMEKSMNAVITRKSIPVAEAAEAAEEAADHSRRLLAAMWERLAGHIIEEHLMTVPSLILPTTAGNLWNSSVVQDR